MREQPNSRKSAGRQVANPGPIRRASLTTLILDQLREFVVANGLNVGDRLPSERELAARLGVSRPTLRLAFNWLSDRGALRRVQGGGTYLQPGFLMALAQGCSGGERDNQPPLGQIVETRVCLEPHMMRLVARRATQTELLALKAELARAAEVLHDEIAWRQHDLHFHTRLAQLAGNEILADALDSVVLHLPAVWETLHEKIEIQQAHEDHCQIVEALLRRDGASAARRMRRHLRVFERAVTGRPRRRPLDQPAATPETQAEPEPAQV